MADNDVLAGERLRVEARPTTLSVAKRVRSFFLNLLGATVVLGDFGTWPPVDIVVVDRGTGRTLKTWHEGHDGGSVLLAQLEQELTDMTYGEFAEKWDLPSGP